jgi:hypothetical protein
VRKQARELFRIELIVAIKPERHCAELCANAYQRIARGRKCRRGDDRFFAPAAQDIAQKEQRVVRALVRPPSFSSSWPNHNENKPPRFTPRSTVLFS